jgi:hypothetical protein
VARGLGVGLAVGLGEGGKILHFKRADVDLAASYPIKSGTTLVITAGPNIGIACVDGRGNPVARRG